jgi:hypothetical protein
MPILARLVIVSDVILDVGDYNPREREHLRRALFWQGFGLLGAECFLHPSADPSAAFADCFQQDDSLAAMSL